MRTPRAVNSLIDYLFERKYRKVGQEKKRIRIFFSSGFLLHIVTPGKGSKYREFYDLSGRITCMVSQTKGTLGTTTFKMTTREYHNQNDLKGVSLLKGIPGSITNQTPV